MAAVDVDDIWAEMQREQQSSRKLKKTSVLSSLQQERHRPKKPSSKKQLDTSLQWMQTWATAVKDSSADTDRSTADVASNDTASIKIVEPPATLIDTVEEIPTGTPETFLAYVQRDINCLSEDNLGVRQQSLLKLERILVQQIDTLPTDIVDAVTDALLKPLLKRLKDKSEKCRELSVKILRSLIENTSDLSVTLGYVFPTLVARLGCEDLEGVAHLPEIMRPNPEQKPTEIARPVEDSEEVRLHLAHFVSCLLARLSQTQVLCYIDEATGLLRAQAMDPFHEVKGVGMETMIAFCHNHTEMLLHFAEPLGRSLTSCLTHNHAKIRITALRTLIAILWCGVWKHNFEVMQILMAWQDPNQVSVKSFYEPDTKVNYMSMLSFDRHPAVRRFWFETIAYILLRIPDKVDHEPYLFTYLVTGLFDENEEIALEVFWLIERCGELYEKEKEEDLRKTKQYGFDYGWTYNGHAFIPFPLKAVWAGGGCAGSVRRDAAHGPDLMGAVQRSEHHRRDELAPVGASDDEVYGIDLGEEVPLPKREYAWPEFNDLVVYRNLPRPRLGSRCWVRTHARRYIKATFNDVVDFRDCTAANAGRLLCMTLAYTEEGVTEWLHPMYAALIKFYSGRAAAAGDSQAMQTYDCVCKLAGVFLDPVSYWEQLQSALDMNCTLYLDQRIASIRVLALCIEGSVEALLSIQSPDPELGMGRLSKVVPEVISAMHSSDLLLDPSDGSRKVMWRLLFAILEPLKEHLTFSQVSQLLFVALALAAKPPPEDTAELAGNQVLGDSVEFEQEELLDREQLDRALLTLNECAGSSTEAEDTPEFSLDDLDDIAPPPAVTADSDPRVVHHNLFERAFADILAHLEDSFQVFRSVMYLSPISVLTSAEHADSVLARLADFCSPSSSPAVRAAGHALGVHLSLRCSKLLKTTPENSGAVSNACRFIWRVFALQSDASKSSAADIKTISYMNIVSGIVNWRQFMYSHDADLRDAFFPPEDNGQERRKPSKPLDWLLSLFVDQELYKKFHAALQHVETSQTGKDSNDFVIMRTKQIREESEHRANVVRALAASTLLVMLRHLFSASSIPWPAEGQRGSLGAIFEGAASLFRSSKPTMDPPWVKPTPPALTLYAGEILHLLVHHAGDMSLPSPFRLRDDAAKAINELAIPAGFTPCLPLALKDESRDALAMEFITALIDLNLSLPPDPEAKHAPTTLSDSTDDEILLGMDCSSTASSGARSGAGKTGSKATVVPREVQRLLSQSVDCLRWNAAMALYTLGLDLAVVCRDGLQRSLARWQRSGEQAKVLVTYDLLNRAARAKKGDRKSVV